MIAFESKTNRAKVGNKWTSIKIDAIYESSKAEVYICQKGADVVAPSSPSGPQCGRFMVSLNGCLLFAPDLKLKDGGL
jgi:hypothetical protein